MALRYVVVVKTDDYHRVYGTYRDRERAEAFAGKINSRVEKVEDAEFEEYRRSSKPDEMAPDPKGSAGVLIVHTPRVRDALRFALGFLEAMR